MNEDRYPIAVERYRGKQSLKTICLSCGHEHLITPDDINQDGMWDCFAGCGGIATFKYAEADFKCPNCGKLHWDKLPRDYWPGVCSRLCSLQYGYARTLAARRVAA